MYSYFNLLPFHSSMRIFIRNLKNRMVSGFGNFLKFLSV
jgi:hypothetical protein